MKRESTALRCRGDRIETWLIIAAAKAASDRRRNGLNWAHLMAARPAAARLPTPSRGCPGSYAALLLPLAVFLICIRAFAASSEAQQQRSDPADVGTVPVRGLLGDELRGAQIPPRRRTPEAKRTTSTGASAPHSKTMEEAGSPGALASYSEPCPNINLKSHGGDEVIVARASLRCSAARQSPTSLSPEVFRQHLPVQMHFSAHLGSNCLDLVTM